MIRLVSLFIFIFLTFSDNSWSMFVNADDLFRDYKENSTLIVDARSSISYLKGHINNAIHLDGGCSSELCYKKGEVPCVLKPLKEIEVTFSKKGLYRDKKIIFYGDNDSWGAEGRLFWLFDKLGYKNISILNGGYQLWKDKGYPTSLIPTINFAKVSSKPLKLENFTMINAKDIESMLRNDSALLIDTRELQEYNGAILYGEKRGGHIPKSIFINWRDFTNVDYTLKSKKEILALLNKKGIPNPDKIDKKVVTVCTGGVRSGFVYSIMKYIGYTDVENYDNGFWEWSALSELPIEK